MPEVSVIIPTYNRADLLAKAIRSVLGQTFRDLELIVVDDGSTDDTKGIVDKFIERDPRIKYIYQRNSGGTSVPRSVGIDNSEGNYIAFLDSDDQWLPEKIEKQIRFFKDSKDERLGFLGCGAIAVDGENDSVIVEYKLSDYYRGNIFEKILKNNFILTPSGVILKKEVLDKVGKFDESFRMVTDWDLWLRISQKYNFDFINEPLFRYYVHGNNITKTIGQENIINETARLYEKYKEYYLKHLPVFYGENLRYFANFYCKLGKMKLGRKYFIESISANRKDCKSYFYFLLSFLGGKFYKFCFGIKKFFLGKKRKTKPLNIEDSPQDIFGLIFGSKA